MPGPAFDGAAWGELASEWREGGVSRNRLAGERCRVGRLTWSGVWREVCRVGCLSLATLELPDRRRRGGAG
jgi:hypothetical protein